MRQLTLHGRRSALYTSSNYTASIATAHTKPVKMLSAPDGTGLNRLRLTRILSAGAFAYRDLECARLGWGRYSTEERHSGVSSPRAPRCPQTLVDCLSLVLTTGSVRFLHATASVPVRLQIDGVDPSRELLPSCHPAYLVGHVAVATVYFGPATLQLVFVPCTIVA